jgi:hypothetical protein
VLVLILLFSTLQRQMLEEAKKASVIKKLDRRAERIRYEKVRTEYSFPSLQAPEHLHIAFGSGSLEHRLPGFQ